MFTARWERYSYRVGGRVATPYSCGMTAVALPLPAGTWDALPVAAQALMLALQAQVVALQTEVAALRLQCRELHA